MNSKLLTLGISLGLLFASCQKEADSADITTEANAAKKTIEVKESSKIHTPEWMLGIHEPDWLGIHEPDWLAIHTPEWMSEMGYFGCGDLYEGPSNLMVNKKDGNLNYSIGSQEEMGHLEKINVGNAELSMCGKLHVHNTVNLHRNGVFTFIGVISIGKDDAPADLVINNYSHFALGGSLHVTGDLIINKGGSLDSYIFRDQDGNPLEGFENYIEVEGDIIIEEGYDYQIEGFEIIEGDHDHGEHEH